MKTFSLRPKDIDRKWYVVDADGQILGRFASQIANRLRGKYKPEFSPHMDNGDFIVVVNCEKIRVTGKKLLEKEYYRHSGWVGGLKEISLGEMLARHPKRVIMHAVKGMLPRNKLGRAILKKLKIYVGPNHPHAAQKPQPLVLPYHKGA
ncbi:MAG: 50S ribosomal protein L13 [Desulfovibrio sp.]|nr:50S ribosomal protein L13 [Desulfovibrio sp.]